MTATIDDLDWRQHATCRNIPDLFFGGSKERNARAVHICHNHCPVLTQCRADAEAAQPAHCVQGGIVWIGGKSGTTGRVGAYQPHPRDCDGACHAFESLNIATRAGGPAGTLDGAPQ